MDIERTTTHGEKSAVLICDRIIMVQCNCTSSYIFILEDVVVVLIFIVIIIINIKK